MIAQRSARIKEVFPLQDAPIRNTNSQGSIVSEISRRMLLSRYDRVTFSKRIFWEDYRRISRDNGMS